MCKPSPLRKWMWLEQIVSRKDVILVSSLVGGFYGAIGYGIFGRQAGTETAAGLGGTFVGMLFGIQSSDRAEELAQEGKAIRAMFKAVQSSIEHALGIGTGGAAAGYEVAGMKGAIVGAVSGAFIGGVGSAQFNFPRVRLALREYRK